MAISLAAKTRTTPPGGAYPYGDIKDDTGSNDGTPVNRQVYADFHQFFAKLLDLAGVVANGLPDNLTNGFQYSVALVALINNIIVAGGYVISGTVDITGLLTTGNVSVTGLLNAHAGADMALTNISNLASPLTVDQATNKFYVDQADTTLQTHITSEASTRGAADITLQTEITALQTGAWAAVSGFASGYQNGGTGSPKCEYRKEAGSTRVWVKGNVAKSSGNFPLSSNTIVFTLPAGYRPSATLRFAISPPGVGSDNIFIQVDAAGEVSVQSGGSTSFSSVELGQFSFSTDGAVN